jgi:hypothetical protein
MGEKSRKQQLKEELSKEPRLAAKVESIKDIIQLKQQELHSAQHALNLCRANIEVLKQQID